MVNAQEPPDIHDASRGETDSSRRPKPMPRVLYRVAVAAIAVAAVGVGYLLYDMASPNTFVGDMYGMIVLMRLAVLAPCVMMLLVGGVLAVVGWFRRRRGLCIAGAVVIFVATVPILGMAGQAAWERHQNAMEADAASVPPSAFRVRTAPAPLGASPCRLRPRRPSPTQRHAARKRAGEHGPC